MRSYLGTSLLARQTPGRSLSFWIAGLACVALASGLVLLNISQIALSQAPSESSSSDAEADAVILHNVEGRTLTGLTINASPSIILKGCSDITIDRCELRAIKLSDCRNVKVVNCWLRDSTRPAVAVDGGSNVRIQGNRIENVASGLYAHKASGVRFIGNNVYDVQGPMPRGQMVQFDKVTGKDNRITYNLAINHRGQSKPEDVISIYRSTGERNAPILIAHNTILGDPKNGSTDKSKSGSGIMLGDGGGAWIVCEHNVLISPGQVGIGVAGGREITVRNNDVFGLKSNVSNVGIYVWNQSDRPGGAITVENNYSNWTNAQGKANPWWNGGGFKRIDTKGNTFERRANPQRLKEMLEKIDVESREPPRPYGEPKQLPWQENKV